MTEPAPESLYLQRAEALIEIDRFREAVPLLTKAYTLNPQNYRVVVSLSICFLNLDEYDSSMRYADEAIGVAPEAEAGYRFKSLCLNNTGRFAESLDFAQRSVSREPHKIVARENLVRLLLNNNRDDEARFHAEKLLALAPAHEIGHFLAGLVELRARNYPEAARRFRRVLEIDPLHAHARHNLGIALGSAAQSGREQQNEAFDHLLASTQLDPSNPVFVNNLKNQTGVVYYLNIILFAPFFLAGWIVSPLITAVCAGLLSVVAARGIFNRRRLRRKIPPAARAALKENDFVAAARAFGAFFALTARRLYRAVWRQALIALAISLIYFFQFPLPFHETAYLVLKIAFWLNVVWMLRDFAAGTRRAAQTLRKD